MVILKTDGSCCAGERGAFLVIGEESCGPGRYCCDLLMFHVLPGSWQRTRVVGRAAQARLHPEFVEFWYFELCSHSIFFQEVVFSCS